jgi:sterol desaturase/sphingolipid hydroxylase (fatty acid hydroxylase superfamily)
MSADQHFRTVTLFADTISAGAILGSFMGLLPPVAALAATIWYAVQIWESHTVQKWWRLHKRHRRTSDALPRRHRLARRLRKVDAV